MKPTEDESSINKRSDNPLFRPSNESASFGSRYDHLYDEDEESKDSKSEKNVKDNKNKGRTTVTGADSEEYEDDDDETVLTTLTEAEKEEHAYRVLSKLKNDTGIYVETAERNHHKKIIMDTLRRQGLSDSNEEILDIVSHYDSITQKSQKEKLFARTKPINLTHTGPTTKKSILYSIEQAYARALKQTKNRNRSRDSSEESKGYEKPSVGITKHSEASRERRKQEKQARKKKKKEERESRKKGNFTKSSEERKGHASTEVSDEKQTKKVEERPPPRRDERRRSDSRERYGRGRYDRDRYRDRPARYSRERYGRARYDSRARYGDRGRFDSRERYRPRDRNSRERERYPPRYGSRERYRRRDSREDKGRWRDDRGRGRDDGRGNVDRERGNADRERGRYDRERGRYDRERGRDDRGRDNRFGGAGYRRSTLQDRQTRKKWYSEEKPEAKRVYGGETRRDETKGDETKSGEPRRVARSEDRYLRNAGRSRINNRGPPSPSSFERDYSQIAKNDESNSMFKKYIKDKKLSDLLAMEEIVTIP